MPSSGQQREARESFRVLTERIAADCREVHRLAETCDLKLRVWEAGTRFEEWRLVVVRRTSGREYQVRCWADWERIKRLAAVWLPGVEEGLH